jgi:hypothetical protein
MNTIAAWFDHHHRVAGPDCEPNLKEHVRRRQQEIEARLQQIEAETDVWLRRERR